MKKLLLSVVASLLFSLFISPCIAANRPVVIEEFVSTNCSHCYGAGMALDRVKANYSFYDVIILAYHVNDSFKNNICSERQKFYGASGTPTVFFNGLGKVTGGPTVSEGESAIANLYNKYVAQITNEQNRTSGVAPFTVNITGVIGPDNPQLTAKISTTSGYQGAAKALFLIIEDNIPYNAQNGLKVLNGVVRAHLGTADFSLPSAGSVDLTGSFTGTVPSSNAANLRPVVIIYNPSTKEALASSAWFSAAPTPTPTSNTHIIGILKDIQTQKPINGATVQIDGGAFQGFTNALGKFEIFGAPSGSRTLQVWGFAYEFKQQNVNVLNGQNTNVGTINLAKMVGTVVGKLVDSKTHEPLAAATVQLDGGNQWRTLTDEQGNFMLIFVTPGAHKLQSWGYAYTFQEKNIDVNASGPTDVGSLAFTIIPDTARGQVVDKNTGRPIMGAQVQYDGGGDGKQTITNVNGRFILVNIPAGSRNLQTWGWAYSFAQKGFTQTSGAATDMGIIQIEPIGGTVNGRLLDAVNGLPVYNAVAQMDYGVFAPWKTASLLNGDFILYNVTGGNHLFQTWGYAYRFQQQNITAPAGGNLNLGDIAMTPDPNTFNGRALDAQTRLPIGGATVILTGNGKNIQTTSFPDGRFVLLNVPQGVYDITVEDVQHQLVHIKSAHPGQNANVDIGDVLLPRN